ncbi:hypothetical protein [Gilvibacter sp.]|uniref:hypothetical protein n=1 Tax=Gilvibacter sp. TaxID=2729997 RepID=UPI003F49E142
MGQKLAIKLLLLSGILAGVISCQVYTVSPESFKIQMLEYPVFTQLDSTDSLYLGPVYFYAYDMEYVFVKDKNGQSKFLQNNPTIEARIYEYNGRKSVFYFDTMELKNDSLSGIRSFLNPERNDISIPFDSIERIEIQNNKKKFYFVEEEFTP